MTGDRADGHPIGSTTYKATAPLLGPAPGIVVRIADFLGTPESDAAVSFDQHAAEGATVNGWSITRPDGRAHWYDCIDHDLTSTAYDDYHEWKLDTEAEILACLCELVELGPAPLTAKTNNPNLRAHPSSQMPRCG